MVFGFDGSKDLVELEEKKAIDICEKYCGVDLGEKGGNHWWEHKYDFFFPPNMFWIPQMFGTWIQLRCLAKWRIFLVI